MGEIAFRFYSKIILSGEKLCIAYLLAVVTVMLTRFSLYYFSDDACLYNSA